MSSSRAWFVLGSNPDADESIPSDSSNGEWNAFQNTHQLTRKKKRKRQRRLKPAVSRKRLRAHAVWPRSCESQHQSSFCFRGFLGTAHVVVHVLEGSSTLSVCVRLRGGSNGACGFSPTCDIPCVACNNLGVANDIPKSLQPQHLIVCIVRPSLASRNPLGSVFCTIPCFLIRTVGRVRGPVLQSQEETPPTRTFGTLGLVPGLWVAADPLQRDAKDKLLVFPRNGKEGRLETRKLGRNASRPPVHKAGLAALLVS
ncbi:hypothetical protein LY78DRAFT_94242 [Colletotrichum sublineola]|nr:hypothetical protein LY78DRAFT_94242 [Colletotrichum sublineola]